MIVREVKYRVGYCDTDMMGIVHHSNYLRYYESARGEILRELGSSYKELEDSGIMMPVLEANSCYKASAFYDDVLTIRVTLKDMPSVKMTFFYEIFNPNGKLINTGSVMLAFINRESRRACRAPGWFIDLLSKYWEE